MRRIFKVRELENPALVIRAVAKNENECFYAAKQVKGDFVRVIPESWAEVSFLQTLEKGYNLFAPWNGNGVLVMAKYLPPYR